MRRWATYHILGLVGKPLCPTRDHVSRAGKHVQNDPGGKMEEGDERGKSRKIKGYQGTNNRVKKLSRKS